MDETHTIAAALPTAENDEQTQFHGRAPRPTAVTALEDLMPRELFIRHIMDLPRTVNGTGHTGFNGTGQTRCRVIIPPWPS